MHDPDQTLNLPTTDTAELRRGNAEEEFRLGQNRILEMIAANKPLPETLSRLVLLIESQAPQMLGSILLLSDDGNHIRHGAAPSLPENYVKAIDGSPIGPKHGSCGTAMYRGEPVIVRDILTNNLWEDFRELAASAGLRACWSTPIMSGRGKVLGSFAMYYREPRTPTITESALIEVATRIAGLAIETQAARETLQRTQAQLAQATHVTTTNQALVSYADELVERLQSMIENANKCLDYLDEDKPEIALFREPLKQITSDGLSAVQTLSQLKPAK